METNSFNVPQQQWNEYGIQGQKFFNQLYQTLRDQKQQFLKDLPQNTKSDIEKLVDRVIMNNAQQATQLYTKSQLQPHDE